MSTLDCTIRPAAGNPQRKLTFSAFSPLPAEIPEDAKLTPTDRALRKALVWYCRGSGRCWPSNWSLGARIRRHPSSVRRSLANLEALGLIRREVADNWAGRMIYLTLDGYHPRAKARAKEKSVIVQREKTQTPHPQRQRLPVIPDSSSRAENRPQRPSEPVEAIPPPQVVESPPEPPQSRGATLTAAEQAVLDARTPERQAAIREALASGDRIRINDALEKLRPRPAPTPEPTTVLQVIHTLPTDPNAPMILASALANQWHDQRSLYGFLAIARAARSGTIPLDALVDALRQASGPKARCPGKILNHALRPFRRNLTCP